MTRWIRPNLTLHLARGRLAVVARTGGGAARALSASASARPARFLEQRQEAQQRIGAHRGSARARSPRGVETVTASPRFRWATAREATSRMRRSKRADHWSSGALAGMARVDDEVDVAPRLARAFAQDELPGQGALAPVDVARVVAVAHRAHGDDFVAVPAAQRAVAAETLAGLSGGRRTGSTAG